MNSAEPQSVEEHICAPSGNDLFFFFGGIAGGLGGIPPFEFVRSAELLSANRIFIRDFEQAWYQLGLPGHCNNPFEMAQWIGYKIEMLQANRVRFVGNSMGGFAALMMNALLGTGRAISFAPQTFISPSLRLFYRERRWARQTRNALVRSFFKRQKVWDLKPLLESASNLNAKIYIGQDYVPDRKHVDRIRDIPGVEVKEIERGGHGLVSSLRDAGELSRIFRDDK